MGDKSGPTQPLPAINPLVVEFAVLNWRESKRFYTDLLGFQIVYDRPDEGFVFLRLGDAQMMFYQANLERNLLAGDTSLERPLGKGVNVQIQVEAIDPLVSKLSKANVCLSLPPEERWYRIGDTELGVRQFAVADPDGYLLRFSEKIGLKPGHPNT